MTGIGLSLGVTGLRVSPSLLTPALDLNYASTMALAGSETFTRASTGWYYNSAGVLTSAATNAARFGYDSSTLAAKGLLLEDARTNSIRNNSMTGVAAGTPGTAPTNWTAAATASGITRTIVATGTVNGLPYVDIKYTGTAVAGDTVLFFDTTTGIAASNATTWTSSVFVSLIAGTLTNVTPKQGLRYRAAAGANIGTQLYETAFVPTSTLTRVERTGTGSDATIAFVVPSLNLTMASGAVDLTLRIAAPQLETNTASFASSPILTTSASVTRAVDLGSINPLGAWFNAAAGTLVVEGSLIGSVVSRNILSISDGTANEAYQINTTSGGVLRANVFDGGVTQAQFNSAVTAVADTTFKVAMAYAVNDIAISANGTTVATDTSATLPTVDRLYLAASATGGSNHSMYYRRLRYYTTRLSDAILQQLTA